MATCLFVCWYKRRSHLKSLSFFLLNAIKTVVSSFAGFCVGHAEHVVGLNSTVDTAITWNGCSQLQARLLCFYSVENCYCLFLCLSLLLILVVSSCRVCWEWVLNIWGFYTEETVYSSRGDGLKGLNSDFLLTLTKTGSPLSTPTIWAIVSWETVEWSINSDFMVVLYLWLGAWSRPTGKACAVEA